MSKKFIDTLNQAINVQNKLWDLDDPANRKQTKEAFLNASLAMAETDLERVKGLKKALGPAVAMARLRMKQRIQEVEVNRPFRHLGSFISEESQLELARRGCSVYELFCVAVLDAIEEGVDCWGPVTDVRGYGERHTELSKERDRLVASLVGSWDATDVVELDCPDQLAKEGYVRYGYRVTNGEIAVGRDSGLALLNWLANNNKGRRTAA